MPIGGVGVWLERCGRRLADSVSALAGGLALLVATIPSRRRFGVLGARGDGHDAVLRPASELAVAAKQVMSGCGSPRGLVWFVV